MSAATAPRETASPRLSRDQVAEMLTELLTDEPQSASSLAAQLGYRRGGQHSQDTGIVSDALGVLEARQRAKRIPNSAGSKQGGWTRWDSAHEAALAEPQNITFPYEFKIVRFDQMFVDENYQRPLTTLVRKIEKAFDPVLFQTLALSDRGTRSRPARYAIIDGQTRWVGGTRVGVVAGPSCVYKNLTPEQEATIFWRLQKERRGHVSWHGFRAKLGSGDKTAHEIKALVETVGFVLGEGQGQLKAVGALEAAYKRDPFTLERTLSDLKEAWPKIVPEGRYIRGLHYFFRHYPIDTAETREIDDEKLVRRLSVAGPDGLLKKQLAAREIATGSPEKMMGLAIQSAYNSR